MFRFCAAVALLPLCVAVTGAARDMLAASVAASDRFLVSVLALAGGGIAWACVYTFLPHPVRTYIFGHELTHAIWGMVFGARFSNLKVGASGGSVRLTKTNTLVTLAPYFFPFYTMLLALVWFVLGRFADLSPFLPLFLFLVGVTWSFHITFTLNSLLIRQPDIAACGRFFSYVLIYLLNVAGIGLWIVCATPVSDTALADALGIHTLRAYAWTGTMLQRAVHPLARMLGQWCRM